MPIKTILLIANIIISVLIIIFILLQGRGAGLGSAWGGGGETFQTRRGVELVVLRAAIVSIIVFFIISLGLLMV
ncbi:MAG: preprotein translocase subunit SecG [Patescibacteria group bacterium]